METRFSASSEIYTFPLGPTAMEAGHMISPAAVPPVLNSPK